LKLSVKAYNALSSLKHLYLFSQVLILRKKKTHEEFFPEKVI